MLSDPILFFEGGVTEVMAKASSCFMASILRGDDFSVFNVTIVILVVCWLRKMVFVGLLQFYLQMGNQGETGMPNYRGARHELPEPGWFHLKGQHDATCQTCHLTM